ncbi:head-tail adaptor [Yersinia phage phiR2-01]|uniref:Head completion protein n=1 Tax=Yersinia phage phiR2-01 TaxID=1206557 RepID=I7KQY3_9CAUD|nr:head-tail adaptor [Yersinia phage phiR2-01]CCI88565.1 hypothetical protein BN79_156 [Yersinia phage phiR2-01]
MEIITTEDYRLYGNLKRPETESQIEMMIAAANTLITSLLGMDDADAVDQLITTKPARKKYFLSSPSATSITKMTINDSEIDAAQYKLYSDGVILLKFAPPNGYMDVEYTQGGFNPMPEDLKLAACMLVDHWAKQDYRQAKTIGGETVTFNNTKSGIPEHIRTIIEVYRRV